MKDKTKNELRAQITELKGQLDTEQKIGAFSEVTNKRLGDISTSIRGVEKDIKNITEKLDEVTALRQEQATTAGKIETLRDNINNIAADMKNIEAQCDDKITSAQTAFTLALNELDKELSKQLGKIRKGIGDKVWDILRLLLAIIIGMLINKQLVNPIKFETGSTKKDKQVFCIANKVDWDKYFKVNLGGNNEN